MANEKSREKLYSLLGKLPEANRPISSRTIAIDENEDFITESLVLCLNGIEEVPAIYTKPKNINGPYPVILFSHSHGGLYRMGKSELITPAHYGYPVPYAKAMADMGIACLAIDQWCFGERYGRTETAAFKSMLWKGQVMWGMMVYDSLRAVDYLVSRSDVDSGRIGATGISMGSTMSIWVAALDTRIKTCADLCCLTDFDELEREGNLDAHGVYYYVPSLQNHFSMADINALIAPRPHLSTAGIYDSLTPVNGLVKIQNALDKAYEEMGAAGRFVLKTYPCGHLETRAMREDVLAFIGKTLLKE
ncbi:MAG: acetylxylan esterase [Defluviitaleaceae bacterium]|nr:acetylxylan esterase [Defluviitaleaceae bacterium]